MAIDISKEERKEAILSIERYLQARIMEVDIEVHKDAFQYWRKFDCQRKGK